MEALPKIPLHIRPSSDRVGTIEDSVIVWSIVDGFLVVAIVCGNILTILAVRFSRKLRSLISSLFVLSLAISDVVVGFTLPYHLAFYIGWDLGENKKLCMLRFFLIILACCVSIWNLIAIAVDRYIAICYPLHYTRMMTKKVASILLAVGWILGVLIASVPLFWNNWETALECEFDQVLHPWYVAGVITPTFSLVWVCLLCVYWRIWREASKHTKQMRTNGLQDGPSDWKSVQVVMIVMGCFTVCWLPYFVVACSQMFNNTGASSPLLYKTVFSLAMANSGMNPLIYAWKNTHFRRAFSLLLKCRSPDQAPRNNHLPDVRTNLHRHSSCLNITIPVPSPTPFQKIIIANGSPQNGNEVTYTSPLNDDNPSPQPPPSLSDSINNNNNSITNIITGNLIINNYNVYENYLDVVSPSQKNINQPPQSNSFNNRNCCPNNNYKAENINFRNINQKFES